MALWNAVPGLSESRQRHSARVFISPLNIGYIRPCWLLADECLLFVRKKSPLRCSRVLVLCCVPPRGISLQHTLQTACLSSSSHTHRHTQTRSNIAMSNTGETIFHTVKIVSRVTSSDLFFNPSPPPKLNYFEWLSTPKAIGFSIERLIDRRGLVADVFLACLHIAAGHLHTFKGAICTSKE